jgi:hypothetical protein
MLFVVVDEGLLYEFPYVFGYPFRRPHQVVLGIADRQLEAANRIAVRAGEQVIEQIPAALRQRANTRVLPEGRFDLAEAASHLSHS